MADRVTYAVVRGPDPVVLLATGDEVISRAIAVHLIAATPGRVLEPEARELIRTALLEERWADALVEWMEATNAIVDVYPDEPVWSEAELDAETASWKIRLSPIFND